MKWKHTQSSTTYMLCDAEYSQSYLTRIRCIGTTARNVRIFCGNETIDQFSMVPGQTTSVVLPHPRFIGVFIEIDKNRYRTADELVGIYESIVIEPIQIIQIIQINSWSTWINAPYIRTYETNTSQPDILLMDPTSRIVSISVWRSDVQSIRVDYVYSDSLVIQDYAVEPARPAENNINCIFRFPTLGRLRVHVVGGHGEIKMTTTAIVQLPPEITKYN